jgi:hypothetical protein
MIAGEELNQELAERVEELEFQRTEIESLNVELRRQIGDRSTQLAAALSLVQRSTPSAVELAPGDRLVERYRVGD